MAALVFAHASASLAIVPLDVQDPTPRSVLVEWENSSDLSAVGVPYAPPVLASYSASGNVGTLEIPIASYETMRTNGSRVPVPDTFSADTIEIDLTTLFLECLKRASQPRELERNKWFAGKMLAGVHELRAPSGFALRDEVRRTFMILGRDESQHAQVRPRVAREGQDDRLCSACIGFSLSSRGVSERAGPTSAFDLCGRVGPVTAPRGSRSYRAPRTSLPGRMDPRPRSLFDLLH